MKAEKKNEAQAPVYVATDLSDHADQAIRRGDAEARRLDAPLVVGHVVPDLVGINILFPGRTQQQLDVQSALRTRALESLIRRVKSLTGRTANDFEAHVMSGQPAAEVLRSVADAGAGLLVIGDASDDAGVLGLFGRTAKKLVRNASVPVLVARCADVIPGVTVAATDFSDPSLPALRAGVDFARSTDGRVVFFHAVEAVPMPLYAAANPGGLGLPMLDTNELSTEALKRLRSAGDAVGAPGTDVRVAVSGAARGILDAIRELNASLVVVGTHGHGGVAATLLGSVAETVVESARCSVLVVRLAA